MKDSDGKPNGARFFYLDSLRILFPGEELKAVHEAGELISYILDHRSEQGHNIVVFIQECAINLALLELDNVSILEEAIKVRNHAIMSGKYTNANYMEDIQVELLLDAASRHLIKYFYLNQITDIESGCHHIGHVLTNFIMISYQLGKSEGK